jgi:hypothetical protein
VVDAAGAIYVIGGYDGIDGSTYHQDVWASTDGGARPDSVGGRSVGYTGWVLRRYYGGTRVLQGVLGAT